MMFSQKALENPEWIMSYFCWRDELDREAMEKWTNESQWKYNSFGLSGRKEQYILMPPLGGLNNYYL